MTRTSSRRLLLFVQIIGLLLLSCLASTAAIGIYNWSASVSTGVAPVVTVVYRLNCPGTVTIELLDNDDQPVHTLGPFTEAAGLHSHEWDGAGAPNGTGSYRARITASNTDMGTPGTLAALFGASLTASIYGLATDRCPDSPAYGTIYVGKANGGQLLAYNADGSAKDWSAGNAVGNSLSLGFNAAAKSSPWGIGVDRLGNIYVASKLGTSNTGVKVFDYLGNELHHVFDTQLQNIVWLDGLVGPQGLEVYETFSNYVRSCAVGDTAWQTVMGPVPSTTARQICFEPGGGACYLATSGLGSPNPGVTRYVRQPSGEWTADTGFDCGLSHVSGGLSNAARYTMGVSCDSRDPDGTGSYKSTSLWMALDCANGTFGGNIVRTLLPGGVPVFFAGPSIKARFIAADSVGNVAIEKSPLDPLWSEWGLYAPAGEATSDVRLTDWVVLAGSAPPEVVAKVCDVKNMDDGASIEFGSAKYVTAVLDGCFYIEESDRSCGVKVKCGTAVTQGSLVKVTGTLATELGERVVDDAEILPP